MPCVCLFLDMAYWWSVARLGWLLPRMVMLGMVLPTRTWEKRILKGEKSKNEIKSNGGCNGSEKLGYGWLSSECCWMFSSSVQCP